MTTEILKNVVLPLNEDVVKKFESTRQENICRAEITSQAWNDFNTQEGSFAEDHFK